MFTSPAQLRRRPAGFTLTELLVVIGIIVIIAAVALPVFNVLTGSRSIEAGQNFLSASLARARAEALSRQQPIGLAVYFDQVRGRTALATVSFPLVWDANVAYQRGDIVYTQQSGSRQYWLCHTDHLSAAASEPAARDSDKMPSTSSSATPPFITGVSGQWAFHDPAISSSPDVPRYAAQEYLSILPETEVVYLPPGIAAQVLNSANIEVRSVYVPVPGPITGTRPSDRYLTVGVILFDASGRLLPNQRWGTLFSPTDAPAPMGQATPTTNSPRFRSTRLGLAVRFNTDGQTATRLRTGISFNLDPVTSSGAQNSAPLVTGTGVILYDRQSCQNFYETVAGAADVKSFDGQSMDRLWTGSPDAQLEGWLDQNGSLFLVNRYTGTLVGTQ
jgi:prepilin-type N-terminal cleavage/methylation domain-containing protein